MDQELTMEATPETKTKAAKPEVKQTICFYDKLSTKDVIRLVGVFEHFSLRDLNIDINQNSVDLKYNPEQVNLASLVNVLTIMGFKVINLR